MINKNISERRKSVQTLRSVIESSSRSNLTSAESEQNILNNIVTLEGYKDLSLEGSGCQYIALCQEGSGNGLKLTTDGFILTAYHNVKGHIGIWANASENMSKYSSTDSLFLGTKYAITDQKRNRHIIDPTIYAVVPEYDLAVIKAIIPEDPEPIRFRFSDSDPELGDELKLLALIDKQQIKRYGRVIQPSYNTTVKDHDGEQASLEDAFLTDAWAKPGFSGSVFTNLKGELEGMCLFAARMSGNEEGCAGGARASNIVSLIRGITDRIE